MSSGLPSLPIVLWVADFSAAAFAEWTTWHQAAGGEAIHVSKESNSRRIWRSPTAYRKLPVTNTAPPAQLALAWLVRRHSEVIPIPGTSSTARLEENVRAADLQLSDEDLNRIENALPKGSAVGERYAPALMKIVNR